MTDEDVDLEPVPLRTSERRLCLWPRPASHAGNYTQPTFVCDCPPAERSVAHLFKESVISPHYRCDQCGAIVLLLSERVYIPRGRKRLTDEPFRVSRPDGWYARETALYRGAAASNSPHGRLRQQIDHWREDAPGADYTGQRRRWGVGQ